MKSILTIVFILTSIFHAKGTASTSADKNYYLVDSLSPNKFNASDTKLIDSCLALYHHTHYDSIRLNLIYHIVAQCSNKEIGIKYSRYLLDYSERVMVADITSPQTKRTMEFFASKAYYSLGRYYSLAGKNKTALKFFQEGLLMAQTTGNEKLQTKCRNNIVTIYINNKDLNEAENYYRKEIERYKNQRDTSNLAISLYHAGWVYYKAGNTERALNYYNQSLTLYNSISDKSKMAIVLNNIALILEDQGKAEQAIECYKKAGKLAEELGNQKGIAIVHGNIGTIYHHYQYWDKALEFYEKALQLFTSEADKRGQADILDNIGALYSDREDYAKAMEYFNKCLAIQKEIENEQGIAACLNNIGGIYQKKNQDEKAIQYYQESLEISDKINYYEGAVNTLLNLAELVIENGRVDKGEKYALKSLQLAQSNNWPRETRNAAKLLTTFYEEQGNTVLAHTMNKLYHTMKDSLVKHENVKALAQIEMKYEALKREQELTKLATDNKLMQQQNKINTYKSYGYLLFALLVLLALAGVIYFNRLLNQKRALLHAYKIERIKADKQKLEQRFANARVQYEKALENIKEKNMLIEQFSTEVQNLKLSAGENFESITAYLSKKINEKEDWDNFSKHFEIVHHGFMENLKKNYPELTGNELRLCTLFKLNLSTKEIANILGVSPDAVYKARHRLRKKFNISSDQDFSLFFSK